MNPNLEPVPPLAVAPGSIPVSSACILMREWTDMEAYWDKAADRHQDHKNYREACMAHAKAEAFDQCSRQLRRLVDDANRRQPE